MLMVTIFIPRNRILLQVIHTLGVKLNKFIMVDNQTFYLVNGIRERTETVHKNPDILGYKVWKNETGKSADQLLNQALMKVRCEEK